MEKPRPKCGLDRDVNACLNILRMWRCLGYPESPSLSVMRLGCQGVYADVVNQAELSGEVGIFPTA
jgi:transposase